VVSQRYRQKRRRLRLAPVQPSLAQLPPPAVELLRADVMPSGDRAALSDPREASASTASFCSSGQFRRRSIPVMISIAPLVSSPMSQSIAKSDAKLAPSQGAAPDGVHRTLTNKMTGLDRAKFDGVA